MNKELCPNCFEPGYSGSCVRCGYSLQYDKKKSEQTLPAGTVLYQRYYLGRVLGEGGFGITYKAYDTRKKQICCVKEYAPNGMCRRLPDRVHLEILSPDCEMPYMAGLRRFLEEAQILSKLEQIPSVVDITETFRENNTAYFVMEYLDGADLRQIVRASRGRLPIQQMTDIILQVAVSMDVIHTKTRIIHRDISPENIYITRSGQVKVIDFGSAKQTETGMKAGLSVVLKPKFAPPEQFSSQMEQGSFTDVYSLAGTYYYALTGVHIPPAPDRLAGKGYVALKYMNLGVPEGISDAVDRALMLSVSQRTRSMQQFIGEIAGGMQAGNHQNRQSSQNRQNQHVSPPVQPNKTAVPYAAVVQGTERGKQWNIPPGCALKMGRSETEAQLTIRKPDNLSRVHCIITYLLDCGRFCIRDVSANGVYYKGKRLMKNTDYNVKPPARFILASQDCVIELGVRYEYR